MSLRHVAPITMRRDPNPRIGPVVGYFVEVAPDDFELTSDRALATHGLIDPAGNSDWQIVPLAEVDGSVLLVRVGSTDNYLGM